LIPCAFKKTDQRELSTAAVIQTMHWMQMPITIYLFVAFSSLLNFCMLFAEFIITFES
jgi:hypothetical protein